MFEGKAEEAMKLYTSIFGGSEILDITRYGPNEAGEEGSIVHATFSIAGQQFMCIESNEKKDFTFTPAISLFVNCETEGEIDRISGELSEVGKY